MADLPGGASGSLVRDYKGREADRLLTRIVSRVALAARRVAAHQSTTNTSCDQVFVDGYAQPRTLRQCQIAFLIHQRRVLHNREPISYTHLRAHETRHDLVCR